MYSLIVLLLVLLTVIVFFLYGGMLMYVLFVLIDYPECEASYYESVEFEDRHQGKSFDRVFYCL